MAKFYATAMPRSVLAAATDLSGRDGEAVPAGFIAEPAADTVPFGAADPEVSAGIDGSAYLAAKTAAMRAHATQITVREPFFALSNRVGQRILAREYYTLLAGPPRARGRETDLFAGLDRRDGCVRLLRPAWLVLPALSCHRAWAGISGWARRLRGSAGRAGEAEAAPAAGQA